MADDRIEHQPWPARAVLLLVLGALLGVAFNALLHRGPNENPYGWTDDPTRIAAATFVAVGGLSFAFTLERLRWWWSVVFALGCGLVAGGIIYWNNGPEGWRFAALLLSIGIAAPIFQIVRDEGHWRLRQQPLHEHVWSNLVLWGAAWLFVLIVFALAFLLSELFGLTGFDFLKNLLRKDWFDWAMAGGSLGAGIGLLRDRDQVLGVMQKVATVVLSFLTPVIALGLAFFLVSLLITGLSPLWKTTQTTPILLGCAFVAFVFANATIGNSAEEEPANRILRYGALVLAVAIVPLALIASVSMGLRLEQHGLTPDRLWAATCVLVALIYGIAYWVALVRGRAAWPGRVRQSNVWLALGVCGLAILLATPIISFPAISTRDQVARLTSGRISPDRFDWRAMAFDFGPSGRKALERLKQAGATQAIRTAANNALSYQSKWEAPGPGEQAQRREALAKSRVLPKAMPLPPELAAALGTEFRCSAERPCTVYYEAGAAFAVIITEPNCVTWNNAADVSRCTTAITALYRQDGRWVQRYDFANRAATEPSGQAVPKVREGWKDGAIEVRPVSRRQVFIGGEPIGEPFE